MKASTSASITALGGVVRGHTAHIHSPLLQWPQYHSLIPKVMSASRLPLRIPDSPSPITTHTASPNEHSHPPACTPSWASEVSNITVSGEYLHHPQHPPVFLLRPRSTAPRLHGITSIWPTFHPRSPSSCAPSICYFSATPPDVLLPNHLCFSHMNPGVGQLLFKSQILGLLSTSRNFNVKFCPSTLHVCAHLWNSALAYPWLTNDFKKTHNK